MHYVLKLWGTGTQTCKMSLYYTTRFVGWKILPKKVRDFDNTKFATMQNQWQNTIILSQNHCKILKTHQFFNRNIANILLPCISRNCHPRNTAKYGPYIQFITKHHMFILKVYPSPEYFTHNRWLRCQTGSNFHNFNRAIDFYVIKYWVLAVSNTLSDFIDVTYVLGHTKEGLFNSAEQKKTLMSVWCLSDVWIKVITASSHSKSSPRS